MPAIATDPDAVQTRPAGGLIEGGRNDTYAEVPERFLMAFLVVTVVALVAGGIASLGWKAALVQEGGHVESLSVAMWLVAGWLALTRIADAVMGRLVAVLVVLFALRELDMHDWFYEPGFLHTAIFSLPVPIWQKLVSGVAMVLILALVVALVWRGARPFWRALAGRQTWALLLAGGVALAGLSTTIDGMDRKLRSLGLDVDLGMTVRYVLIVLEEAMELGFAMLVIAAILWATSRTSVQAVRRM